MRAGTGFHANHTLWPCFIQQHLEPLMTLQNVVDALADIVRANN